MPIVDLLDRLEKVRKTGDGRYVACCPAHKDRSPSLAIREVDDGRILLKCFAGCSVIEVVESVGLRLADLMPPLDKHQYKAMKEGISYKQSLLCLSRESMLVWTAARNLANGIELSDKDRARLGVATGRIQEAMTLCGL